MLGHIARLVHLADAAPAAHMPACQDGLHGTVELRYASPLLHRHRVLAARQPQRVLAGTVQRNQRQVTTSLRDVGSALGILGEQT
jgi:hypothetical protein